jgi:hypothetical protein
MHMLSKSLSKRPTGITASAIQKKKKDHIICDSKAQLLKAHDSDASKKGIKLAMPAHNQFRIRFSSRCRRDSARYKSS